MRYKENYSINNSFKQRKNKSYLSKTIFVEFNKQGTILSVIGQKKVVGLGR